MAESKVTTTKTKLKEETIEKVVYPVSNGKVAYQELYKINGIIAKIDISTDYSNTFGAYIYTLNKETLKWNELYTIHSSLLKVYADHPFGIHADYKEREQLKNKQSFYIGKFKEDADKLKSKLIEILF